MRASCAADMVTAGRPSSDAMRDQARYNVIINSMSSWAVIDFYVKTHAHVAGAGAEDVQWDGEFSVTVKQLLKSEMRDGRGALARSGLIALADSQLRGALYLARGELIRLPDLAPADLDWATFMMHHAASCGVKTRLNVCVDAATCPESKGKKFMELRYIIKNDPGDADYAWIFTVHKSLAVDARSGHMYNHLEFNDHPGMDPGCRALFMRVADVNMGMGSFDSEVADRVVNNMPYPTLIIC